MTSLLLLLAITVAADPLSAGDHNRKLTVDGRERTYLVHVPAKYAHDQPTPVVLNAGVWIDHKQAIVVLITDAGQEIKRIALNIGQPALTSKSASGKHKYTPNDFIAEDKLERKSEAGRKSYFDDVIACIRGAGSLLILGPGEAKGEFNKHLKAKKVRGVVVELETADKNVRRSSESRSIVTLPTSRRPSLCFACRTERSKTSSDQVRRHQAKPLPQQRCTA